MTLVNEMSVEEGEREGEKNLCNTSLFVHMEAPVVYVERSISGQFSYSFSITSCCLFIHK